MPRPGTAGTPVIRNPRFCATARAGGNVTSAAPSPIPPNPDFFGLHVYFPVEGSEPASIFDFNGFCGITELQGTGTLTMGGHTTKAYFDVDNRFMTGEYVCVDGGYMALGAWA